MEKLNYYFRIVMAILFVVTVLLLTVKFIKVLPAFVKVIALAGNIATIYLAVDYVKRKIKSNKNQKNTENE